MDRELSWLDGSHEGIYTFLWRIGCVVEKATVVFTWRQIVGEYIDFLFKLGQRIMLLIYIQHLVKANDHVNVGGVGEKVLEFIDPHL